MFLFYEFFLLCVSPVTILNDPKLGLNIDGITLQCQNGKPSISMDARANIDGEIQDITFESKPDGFVIGVKHADKLAKKIMEKIPGMGSLDIPFKNTDALIGYTGGVITEFGIKGEIDNPNVKMPVEIYVNADAPQDTKVHICIEQGGNLNDLTCIFMDKNIPGPIKTYFNMFFGMVQLKPSQYKYAGDANELKNLLDSNQKSEVLSRLNVDILGNNADKIKIDSLGIKHGYDFAHLDDGSIETKSYNYRISNTDTLMKVEFNQVYQRVKRYVPGEIDPGIVLRPIDSKHTDTKQQQEDWTYIGGKITVEPQLSIDSEYQALNADVSILGQDSRLSAGKSLSDISLHFKVNNGSDLIYLNASLNKVQFHCEVNNIGLGDFLNIAMAGKCPNSIKDVVNNGKLKNGSFDISPENASISGDIELYGQEGNIKGDINSSNPEINIKLKIQEHLHKEQKWNKTKTFGVWVAKTKVGAEAKATFNVDFSGSIKINLSLNNPSYYLNIDTPHPKHSVNLSIHPDISIPGLDSLKSEIKKTADHFIDNITNLYDYGISNKKLDSLELIELKKGNILGVIELAYGVSIFFIN